MRTFCLYILIGLFIIAEFSSCEKGFLPSDRNVLIVEGWIEAGGYPVIMVSQSLPVRKRDDAIPLDQISDYVVTWAKVTVSNQDTSVILTGKRDDHYVPGYIYTTGGLRGVAGKTYNLKVEYGGVEVQSVTTIPLYPPVIDTVVYNRLSSDPENGEITVYVKNIPDRKEYFKSFYTVGTDERQYLSSYLGVVDDALTDTVFPMPIIRGITDIDYDDYNRFFPVDSVVSIKISTMDSISYEIWKGYEDNARFSSSFMSSSIRDIPTNIIGGNGYWCGYNSKTIVRLSWSVVSAM